jgi:hypothetical protein
MEPKEKIVHSVQFLLQVVVVVLVHLEDKTLNMVDLVVVE